MGRWKSILSGVLTLSALGLLAFAPQLFFSILDSSTLESASLHPMQSLELSLHEEFPGLGGLAMLSRMDGTIALPDNAASMTRDQVMEAVYAGLQPYQEIQLLQYSEKDVELNPRLIQISDHPQLQNVVWNVIVQGDAKSSTFCNLVIDDETGKIIQLSYHNKNGLTGFLPSEVLPLFSDIFFGQLGIYATPELLEVAFEEQYIGINEIINRYSFSTKEYGEITVDLCAYDYGFYVEFPGSRPVLSPYGGQIP